MINNDWLYDCFFKGTVSPSSTPIGEIGSVYLSPVYQCDRPLGKGGSDSETSVDWSKDDTLLPGESISKVIVLLQNPRSFEQFSDTSVFMQKIWIGKAILSFQTKNFFKVKRYKYFYAKNFESAKKLYHFKDQNY